MGKFESRLSGATGHIDANASPTVLNGLWDRPRSTAEESLVGVCTGPVNVTITTQPTEGGANKVKILWLRVVGEGQGGDARKKNGPFTHLRSK